VEPVGEVADDVGDDGGQVLGEEGAEQALAEGEAGQHDLVAFLAPPAAQPEGLQPEVEDGGVGRGTDLLRCDPVIKESSEQLTRRRTGNRSSS
jgi:hypothetical protein